MAATSQAQMIKLLTSFPAAYDLVTDDEYLASFLHEVWSQNETDGAMTTRPPHANDGRSQLPVSIARRGASPRGLYRNSRDPMFADPLPGIQCLIGRSGDTDLAAAITAAAGSLDSSFPDVVSDLAEEDAVWFLNAAAAASSSEFAAIVDSERTTGTAPTRHHRHHHPVSGCVEEHEGQTAVDLVDDVFLEGEESNIFQTLTSASVFDPRAPQLFQCPCAGQPYASDADVTAAEISNDDSWSSASSLSWERDGALASILDANDRIWSSSGIWSDEDSSSAPMVKPSGAKQARETSTTKTKTVDAVSSTTTKTSTTLPPPQPETGRKRRRERSKTPHLWKFMRMLLDDSSYNPTYIRWENKSEGVFRIVPGQSKHISVLWGQRKNNPSMTFDKLSRSLRWCRKYGFFRDVPKTGRYPKKLCFRFAQFALDWSPPIDSVPTETIS